MLIQTLQISLSLSKVLAVQHDKIMVHQFPINYLISASNLIEFTFVDINVAAGSKRFRLYFEYFQDCWIMGQALQLCISYQFKVTLSCFINHMVSKLCWDLKLVYNEVFGIWKTGSDHKHAEVGCFSRDLLI